MGRISHLPLSVNHYLILNVTLGCVLELWLWFRQGKLTTGSSDSDLDKLLVTYSQVESNQFEIPHVDLNCLWLLKPFYFIVIIIGLLFWLMKAFTAASLLHCFILQLLSKLWDPLCELCICLHIYMLKFTWYQSLGGQDSSPPQISSQIIFFQYCTKSGEFTT